MNQQLILNIIKFNHPVRIKDFSFYKESGEGRFPIDKDELPVNIEEIFPIANIKFLYTDFVSNQGAKTVSVNLGHSKRFAKHYYTWLIGRYFKDVADISLPNFVNDIELWFHDKKASKPAFKVFRKFVLRVQIGRITDAPELVVSYEGSSKVLNKSLFDEDYNPEKLKTVIYQKQIFSYKQLSNEALQNLKDIFPVLNPSLRRSIGLHVELVKIENKIKNYFEQINWFYKTYLSTDEFKALIPIDSEGFTNIEQQRIRNTTYGSNALLFGNGKLDINPMNGMKSNGPYKPTDHKIVKFIFIYYDEDKDTAIELYKYFLGRLNKPEVDGKYKKFKGLRQFINLQYTVNKEDHLVFKNKNNPLPEIREQIQNKSYTPDAHYVGIYISPHNKDCENLTYKKIYYQVKEELLKHGITSQVVEKETIWMEDFFFSLPNIAVAILAKLEGIPWRLKRTVINELVVGVGAFKAKSVNARYVGSAFCFSNDGHFQGFNCYPANDTIMLAGSIRDAVQTFYKKNNKVERLIIHFYKRLSKKELAPILEKLNNLGVNVPVIIISINKTESKDYVVFDLACDNLIPDSGTFIDIDRNQYLLCNNTRYGDRMPNKIEGYPLPVKLTIKANPESYTLTDKILTDLIDQVYQFSRMYWKSVSQQNLPVTIKYPEMVAEIFPHFDSNIIPPFGQNNLWFL